MTVNLSAASGQSVTVDYATADVTAVAGSDYTAASGTLTFTAGQVSKTVDVTLNNDALDEADETFTFTLTNPVNTSIITAAQTVTITDDDATPSVTLTSAGQTVAESAGSVTITAQLSAVSGQNVTVPYTVSGTAALVTDHDLADSSIVITAGSLTGNAVFNVTDDAIIESGETVIFTVTVGGLVNASAGATTAHTVTISTNDQTITVNSTTDTDDGNIGDGLCETVTGNSVCTLRAAIRESNLATGTQTISIPAATTITLSSGTALPTISGAVTITGGDQTTTVVSASGATEIVTFTAAATVSTMTFQQGSSNTDGGAIVINNVAVTMSYVNVIDSATVVAGLNGGAIYVTGASGSLSIDHCTVSNNTATGAGGGIYFSANTTGTVDYCLFDSNTAFTTGGGAIGSASGGTLTVRRSLFTNNIASNVNGGALYLAKTSTIENNTITSNTGFRGGGVYVASNTSTLINNTITDNDTGTNTDAGGLKVTGGTAVASLRNNIIGDNLTTSGGATDNCRTSVGGTITSVGYNLSDTSTADCPLLSAGDIPSGTLTLSALADNGGPTQTMAISSPSDAIDSGTNTSCPATDQRGFTRPDTTFNVCDIGAYEIQ